VEDHGVAWMPSSRWAFLAIDLAEDVARQADPVDRPLPLDRRGVGEPLVAGLEEPPGRRVEVIDVRLRRRRRARRSQHQVAGIAAHAEIGAEEDPIRVLQEDTRACRRRAGRSRARRAAVSR
jgi:hypothetical protein